MEILTLSRYVLESSLQDYEFVDCVPSKIASACLALAFRMKKESGKWDKTLEHHTSYNEAELIELMGRLNKMIKAAPNSKLQTVRNKYSHPIFYEVAKIKPVDSL